MTAFSPTTEWFLARDGQQFGPVTGVEFQKVVELGHLKPTDLVWCQGMPEWRVASDVVAELLSQTQTATSPDDHADAATHVENSGDNRADNRATTTRARPTEHARTTDAPNESAQTRSSNGQSVAATEPHASTGHASGAAYDYRPEREPRQRPRTLSPDLDFSNGDTPEQTSTSQAAFQANGSRNGGPQFRKAEFGETFGPDQALTIDPANAKTSAKAGRRRRGQTSSQDGDEELHRAPGRSRLAAVGRWTKRVAILVFFASTLSAAAWYAWPFRDQIMGQLQGLATSVSSGGSAGGSTSQSPLAGFSANTEDTDQALQKSALWRILKRDFPDWYTLRVKEAASLARGQKSDTDIALYIADALAKLRRQHAGDALSAPHAQLQTVAASFAESLARLRSHSVDACYTFITVGEANPTIVPLLDNRDIAGPLQKQMIAVFSAVNEGRRTPRVYPQPKQGDYDVLVKELQSRGWTQNDMKLFSNSQALAKAPPDKVCTLVTQWFESQMAIKDPDMQLRLLVDSLRPVVAG
jgi:GYF domain 2